MIVLALVYRNWNRGQKPTVMQQKLINQAIIMTVVFCASDMLGWCLQGQSGLLAHYLLYIADILYFIAIVVIAYLWHLCILFRIGRIDSFRHIRVFLSGLPIGIFVLFALTTPLTGWIFRIDADNVYHRGPLLLVHWIVVVIYVLLAEINSYIAYKKSVSNTKKEYYKACMGFAVFSLLITIPQFIFYGLTTAPVGLTFSVLYFVLNVQNIMVQTDSLTSCHNRRALDNYIDSLFVGKKAVSITAVMMDIDGFKSINDRFGHAEGDRILRYVSVSVKDVCAVLKTVVFVCRYGGDEFLLLCKDCSPEELNKMLTEIAGKMKEADTEGKFVLSVSAGAETGDCRNAEDVQALIKKADNLMYEKKNEYKRLHQTA